MQGVGSVGVWEGLRVLVRPDTPSKTAARETGNAKNGRKREEMNERLHQ